MILLCCHNFSSVRLALMNDLNLIDSISQLNETALANILLYGDSKKSTSENSKISQSTIKYIIATKRFDSVQMRSTTHRLNYHKCLSI